MNSAYAVQLVKLFPPIWRKYQIQGRLSVGLNLDQLRTLFIQSESVIELEAFPIHPGHPVHDDLIDGLFDIITYYMIYHNDFGMIETI